MIGQHIVPILYVTGSLTGLMLLQFLLPRFYAEKVLKITLPNDAATFYFAHWGLVVFALAVLLVWATQVPEMRKPVVAVALMEKAALAVWIFKDHKKPYAKMILGGAIFDTVTCLLYAGYLLGY